MNRNDYWRKREEEQLKHYLTEEADIQRAMAEKYNYMLYQIQAQINDFYARYARREQITLAEAMQRVSKMDVQAFAAKAKKYVEKRDFSPKANRELRLYNATMRINRLELLKANIGLEMVDGFNDLEHLMDNSLTKRTTDELKRQEEILRRDAGILGESISNNAKTVGSIVNASFNNATWSERIWGNQTQLRNELSSLLTQGLIQGRNPRVLAPALEKMFGVSRRNAERLMATELARVQTDAQMQTFKENDIDEYIFLSMDTACKTCMALNEEHFPVKDAMPGENAPPIHPNCRCSTAAYIDREALERELFGEERLYERGEDDPRAKNYLYTNDEKSIQNILDRIDIEDDPELIKFVKDNILHMPLEDFSVLDKAGISVKRSHGSNFINNEPIIDKDGRKIYEIRLDPKEGLHLAFAHEYVHFAQLVNDLYNDKEFRGVLNHFADSVIRMDYTFIDGSYYGVAVSDLLVSDYQGRTYVKETPTGFEKEIEATDFVEYITKGYEAYISNPKMLEKKDKMLYDYFRKRGLRG